MYRCTEEKSVFGIGRQEGGVLDKVGIMNIKEKVSVIMPAYNCGKFIGESIRSVQAQTYENWELLIVDDVSTDDTAEVVAAFLGDDRIRYYCLQENGGPAAARNEALRRAQGDYIAFLDSDDIWMPEKLEHQLAFMKKNGYFFTCTGYKKTNEAGAPLGIQVIPRTSADYWKAFFLGNPIGNSTVIYDRRHFGDRQIPPIRKRNDFALWLQLLREGDACYGMEDVLMAYRVRNDSISSKKIRLAKYQWELYRHIEKKSLMLSCLGVLSWAVVKGTGLGLRVRKSKENTHDQ